MPQNAVSALPNQPELAANVLHSANAGLLVRRSAQIERGCGQVARVAGRRLVDWLNTKRAGQVSALLYEDVGRVRDRLTWLLHFPSFQQYEELSAGGDEDSGFDLFSPEALDDGSPGLDELFVPGSVREQFLLPHRWGAQGTATERMIGDASIDPLAPGENPPRFVVLPAADQTELAPADILHSANSKILMVRQSSFNYEFRNEARVFARTIAENVNLNLRGTAAVFLYEEPFGQMDTVHWLIHIRSLSNLYHLMGLDARTDPDAPRASFIQQWIAAEKGGGSWERILVQGSVRDTALRRVYGGI